MEEQVTRCDIWGDFNHFVSHHWLPFQSMVFSFIEHPHCASATISFPTPSCASPLYGDGGLEVNSQLWSTSSIPSLESLTPPSSAVADLDCGHPFVQAVLTFRPTLLPLEEGNSSMLEGVNEGGDSTGGGEGELDCSSGWGMGEVLPDIHNVLGCSLYHIDDGGKWVYCSHSLFHPLHPQHLCPQGQSCYCK